MELNPNHQVVQALHDQWHTIVAILLHKQGETDVELTEEDVRALQAAFPQGQAVVADARGGRFVLRLMPIDKAMALARAEGGLAQ
jgi:hypothetical protein